VASSPARCRRRGIARRCARRRSPRYALATARREGIFDQYPDIRSPIYKGVAGEDPEPTRPWPRPRGASSCTTGRSRRPSSTRPRAGAPSRRPTRSGAGRCPTSERRRPGGPHLAVLPLGPVAVRRGDGTAARLARRRRLPRRSGARARRLAATPPRGGRRDRRCTARDRRPAQGAPRAARHVGPLRPHRHGARPRGDRDALTLHGRRAGRRPQRARDPGAARRHDRHRAGEARLADRRAGADGQQRRLPRLGRAARPLPRARRRRSGSGGADRRPHAAPRVRRASRLARDRGGLAGRERLAVGA
jgi:hypothetical protein